jgi:hypothetical protein
MAFSYDTLRIFPTPVKAVAFTLQSVVERGSVAAESKRPTIPKRKANGSSVFLLHVVYFLLGVIYEKTIFATFCGFVYGA